jgi:hypothetical protein
MKLNFRIIISKGMAYVLVGAFTPWTAALAQWINSGESPPHIVWWGVILPASIVGAASQWISFTSSSWSNFQQGRKADADNTAFIAKPTEIKP